MFQKTIFFFLTKKTSGAKFGLKAKKKRKKKTEIFFATQHRMQMLNFFRTKVKQLLFINSEEVRWLKHRLKTDIISQMIRTR